MQNSSDLVVTKWKSYELLNFATLCSNAVVVCASKLHIINKSLHANTALNLSFHD